MLDGLVIWLQENIPNNLVAILEELLDYINKTERRKK